MPYGSLLTPNSPLPTKFPSTNSPLRLRFLRLRRATTQRAAVGDALLQIRAVEPGTHDEEHRSHHHGDSAVLPRVAADQGGGHAEHPQPDRRFAAEVTLGARLPAAL